MISVVTWRWGSLFSVEYVNRLRGMLARRLRLPHQLYCVTDDPAGLHSDVVFVPMPREFADTPRCRRRMQQYSADFDRKIGGRLWLIDLDVVIVADITELLDRPEPIVCWRIGYADVYAGGCVLWNAGALDGAWQAFHADPEGYPKRAQPHGVGSDLAMLNCYLKTQPPVAEWTEADGLVSYFGAGYERLEHHGVGPNRPTLPPGTKIVVLGSADKQVMDDGTYPWIREHWTAL